MAKCFTMRGRCFLIGLPRHLTSELCKNWGMAEHESIWDLFDFFHAFHFSLPAALFSTQSFQQCSSHPPHSLAMADRADPKLRGSSREMQIKQAPWREVFCIYLLSLLGTSPPASEARGSPWIFSDKSFKKPLQGSLLRPWSKSGFD